MNPMVLILVLSVIVVLISTSVIYGIIAFFKEDQILQNGIPVEGCIIGHRKDFQLSMPYYYYLRYRYEYKGKSFIKEKSVSKKTYSAYPDGTKISVRCVSDDPTRAASADLL